MQRIDVLTPLHTATKRDYVQRVVEHAKAACAEVAGQLGGDDLDGERQYGYGGYRDDGRGLPVAEALAEHYGLKAGDKVLDIGCGKAFLLYELTQAVPGIQVAGRRFNTIVVKVPKADGVSELKGEVESLGQLDHENVVLILGMAYCAHKGSEEPQWSMMLEYAESDLKLLLHGVDKADIEGQKRSDEWIAMQAAV